MDGPQTVLPYTAPITPPATAPTGPATTRPTPAPAAAPTMSACALGVAAAIATKAAVAAIKLRIGLLLSLDMSALPITRYLFIRLTPGNHIPLPADSGSSAAV